MPENYTCWGIHTGDRSDVDRAFLDDGLIAIGWPQIGDLAELAASRKAFKKRYREIYPDAKDGAIPVQAGQLFRFVNEMEQDHLVIYPSKVDKQIHIGRVTGDYEYRPDKISRYPQTREVEWRAHVPRTTFSQGALYESGSAMTLFQIQNYAEEFIAAYEGREYSFDTEDDESVSLVADEIEQTARNFVHAWDASHTELEEPMTSRKGLEQAVFAWHDRLQTGRPRVVVRDHFAADAEGLQTPHKSL